MAALVEKNPISRLQEICQQWKQPLPVYRECQGSYSEFGTEITVNIDGESLSFQAKGRTKKISKANVAEEALKFIKEHKPYLLEPPAQPDIDVSEMTQLGIWKKGNQANKQHTASVDHDILAKETEQLSHVKVGLDVGMLIQQCRLKAQMSQRELAAKINEKVGVITDYESGRAIPNQQIISKMERALGVHLRGERAGQPKMLGRGRKPAT